MPSAVSPTVQRAPISSGLKPHSVGRADGGLDAHAWQRMGQPATVYTCIITHSRYCMCGCLHAYCGTILRRCNENGLPCTLDRDSVGINMRCASVISGVSILPQDNLMNPCPSMREAGSAESDAVFGDRGPGGEWSSFSTAWWTSIPAVSGRPLQ
jgi:hypothetical protein